MGNVKVKCLNPHRFGQKVSLPLIGETVIPKDGILELDENVAKVLLDGGHKSYQLLDDLNQEEDDSSKGSDGTKKTSKKSKKEAKKVKEEEADEDDNDSDSDEDSSEEDNSEEDSEEIDEEDNSLEDLDKLELPELIDMAKTLGHKPKSFEKFAKSKKLMINFLKKN